MTTPLTRLTVALGLVVITAMPAFAQAPQEEVEYYGRDAIGSLRVVFDANGAIVGRMDYGPFGSELRAAAGLPPQRFAGLVRDGEAGLDYGQARSYQVRTGRFTTIDPLYAGPTNPQSWNRYAYVSNAPVGFTDPDGREMVAVNCGPGPQWCPGNIRIGPNEWVHQDSPFTPGWYGYQGGKEAEMAEAVYASNIESAFAERAAASFGRRDGQVVTSESFEANVDGKRETLEAGILGPVAKEILTQVLRRLGLALIGGSVALQQGSRILQHSAGYLNGMREAAQRHSNLVGRVEFHHIWPKFLGGPANGPTIPLDRAYHRIITMEFQRLWGYGGVPPSLEKAQEIMLKVYEKYPLW